MITLVASTFMAMLAISAIAGLILPAGAQVPMQWDLRGQPTWRAPKLIALMFSPILSLMLMSGVALTSASDPQKVESILLLIAGLFLVVHVFHIALARWHFNANKS